MASLPFLRPSSLRSILRASPNAMQSRRGQSSISTIFEATSIRVRYDGRDIDVSCYDSAPTDNPAVSRPVVLFVHGSPGSYRDFKFVYPSLLARGARVICANFPEHGYTPAPSFSFRHTSIERAEFLADFLHALRLPRVDALVAHSAGFYPSIRLTAEYAGITRSLILVNPGGITPHRALRPYWLIQALAYIYEKLSIVGFIFRPFFYLVYNYIVGLRVRTGAEAAAVMQVAGGFGFGHVPTWTKLVGEQSRAEKDRTRVIVLYGVHDHLVDVASSELVCSTLGIPSEAHRALASTEADETHVEAVCAEVDEKGSSAVRFHDLGHFVQRDAAEWIANLLLKLVF